MIEKIGFCSECGSINILSNGRFNEWIQPRGTSLTGMGCISLIRKVANRCCPKRSGDSEQNQNTGNIYKHHKLFIYSLYIIGLLGLVLTLLWC